MCFKLIIIVMISVATAEWSYGQSDCNPGSIKEKVIDKGREFDRFLYDQFEESLSEEARKRNASGQYGAISGSAAEDKSKRAERMFKSSLNISQEEWRDYSRWYWSLEALQAYQSCLEAFTRVAGLHLKVIIADAEDVYILVRYLAGPKDDRTAKLKIGQLSGGKVVDPLPEVESGGGTLARLVKVRREPKKPVIVQLVTDTYSSDPVRVPAYFRIVERTETGQFTSPEVKAYCPYGPAVEAQRCFNPPSGGKFTDITPEVTENKDYGANPHAAQTFSVITKAENRICVRAYCYPVTKKGAEIAGRVHATVIKTVFEKRFD